MVLRRDKIFVKTLVSEESQKTLIRCGQLLKIKKKTCPQCCLQGGQLFQRVETDLKFLKLDFKGVFKCCEQLEESDPILTTHPHR